MSDKPWRTFDNKGDEFERFRFRAAHLAAETAAVDHLLEKYERLLRMRALLETSATPPTPR